MKYPRPAYNDPAIKTQTVGTAFSNAKSVVPKFDAPITPVENYRRNVARDNPIWVPCSLTDFQSLLTHDVAGTLVRGMQIHSDLKRPAKKDYCFKDWFGTDWTFVCSAGGAMLTPGTQLVSDITKWEKEIVWPDLSEWRFEEKAEEYMRETYNPEKVMHYDLGRGCTERLVSIMGGYTESMIALALEPEAVADFFDAYSDFVIAFFDKINSLYPLDVVTLHDDWGTERDTFFSEKMMEDIVFSPTKKIVDHIKSKGVVFELHSCGNVTRFVPYAIDMGAQLLQLQRRAVNLPEMKKKYGDKVGFSAPMEGFVMGADYSKEEIISIVRDSLDIYATGGGCYTSIMLRDPEKQWVGLSELYYYGRELYDREFRKD
ncbi:MAG: hypothetical protein GXY20_05030 [Clostridiales bacterium]|nr:hypothetical protein [Clostridiales bacterium]